MVEVAYRDAVLINKTSPHIWSYAQRSCFNHTEWGRGAIHFTRVSFLRMGLSCLITGVSCHCRNPKGLPPHQCIFNGTCTSAHAARYDKCHTPSKSYIQPHSIGHLTRRICLTLVEVPNVKVRRQPQRCVGDPALLRALSALQEQSSQLCSVNVLHEMGVSLIFAKARNGRNSKSVALAHWLTEGKLVTV